MEFQDVPFEIHLRLATEHLLERELFILIYWHDCTVYMWIGLVKMDDKRHNVFLTIFLTDKVIDVLCPLFNLGLTMNGRVVSSRCEVHLLAAKGQLTHPFP